MLKAYPRQRLSYTFPIASVLDTKRIRSKRDTEVVRLKKNILRRYIKEHGHEHTPRRDEVPVLLGGGAGAGVLGYYNPHLPPTHPPLHPSSSTASVDGSAYEAGGASQQDLAGGPSSSSVGGLARKR